MTPVLKHVGDTIRQLQPYQPGRPISDIARERGVERVVKLASNENPLGAGADALAAVRALGGDALALYPDANGTALREAIARHLNVAAAAIVLGNGSNEILELAAHLTLHKGAAAVYSEHAFIVYKLATATRHATPRVVPARDFSHDLPAMAAAAQQDDVRLMFIANPNNPTGTWHPPQAIRKLLGDTPPQVLVVLDEAYHEYATDGDDGETLALLDDFPNLLITRTFSKIHGIAGLRAGYGIAAADVVEMLNRIRQPFNMNTAAQVAATAALADEAHVQKSINLNREGMALLTAAFERMDIPHIPSYGNFLSFRPPAAVGGADEVYENMLNHGFITRKLQEYNMGDWLRLTIGTPAQNEQFIRLLEKPR